MSEQSETRLPDDARNRLSRLVDRKLYGTDAQYHAEVRRITHLLDVVEMALQDEGVDRRVIERVLKRIVYGTPDGADAYERINAQAEAVRRAMVQPPYPSPSWRSS